MIKLAILGAAGRMGQALVRCATAAPDLVVAAAIEQAGHPAAGRDAGTLAGVGDIGVPIGVELEGACAGDVFLDFTFHTAVVEHACLAARAGKAMVIGTTGLDERERASVSEAAVQVPLVWAPNMSLGVNLLFRMVGEAARALGLDYDAEIVEMHHRHKKDAPSGTALRLGERIADGRGQVFEAVARHGRQGMVGERARGEIGMHAVRGGDVVGDHRVIFSTEGEQVEFLHRATSRDALARGGLQAARWVFGRKPGLYDMNDVLGLA